MTGCAQHLGCYLEGQGHSMTLQQNRVRLITLLFEVGYDNYFNKLLLCVQYLFGEHYPVRPALVLHGIITMRKYKYVAFGNELIEANISAISLVQPDI